VVYRSTDSLDADEYTSVSDLIAQGLIGKHHIPKYEVTGFPNNNAEWTARDALLLLMKLRYPAVRRAYRKPRAEDTKAGRYIPKKFKPVFYALRMVGRIWQSTVYRLEASRCVSFKMADTMLSCPPTGFMVQPVREELKFRACRHRMCPWCHYRMVLDTYRSLVDRLFDERGYPREQNLNLVHLLVTREVPVQDLTADYGSPMGEGSRESFRKHRRQYKFTDGLGTFQVYPVTLFGYVQPRKALCFQEAIVGLSPVEKRVKTVTKNYRFHIGQRSFSPTGVRRSLTLSLYYPYSFLDIPDRGLFGETTIPGILGKRRRLRPFGNWKDLFKGTTP
jgi:hypothetical protein